MSPLRPLRPVLAVSLAAVSACTPAPRALPDPAGAAPLNGTPPATRPPVPGAPAGVTAFVGVNVVPMDTERVLANQTVLVEGGRITALGPAGNVRVPGGAMRIDGRSKYLMPGLADMHTHFGMVITTNPGMRYDSADVERRLFRWLAEGVTTVRNMDYMPPRPFKPSRTNGGESLVSTVTLSGEELLRLRARAAAGELWSPRIYTAGPRAESADGRRGVAASVAAYKAAGYDFLKMHNESPEIFDSLAAAARRVGLPFEGHAEDGVPFERILTSGMRSIEHLSGYLHSSVMGNWLLKDTSVAHLHALASATKQAGVWNCPTLGIRRDWPPEHEKIFYFRLVKAFQDMGAGLLLGTDVPLPYTEGELHGPPGQIHHELQLLVTAGLTPYQALVTGTRNVAQFFGTLDSSGTVAVGKRADLVLLSGNPLRDIQHTTRPAGVMIGGRWLPRAEIDRHLALRTPGEQREFDWGRFKRGQKEADSITSSERASSESEAQQALRKAQAAERKSLTDSLLSADAVDSAGVRRMVRLLARQLGEHRRLLPPARQAEFDPKAQAWLRRRAAEGDSVEIPGIRR